MTYFEKHQAEYLEGLKQFLRIPSISTLSEHKPDVRRAAEFVRSELERVGMQNAHLIEGEGNPLVYAEWLGAPGKPTVLFYGHYDVQPADPLEEWVTPPFEPDVRGQNIHARGAADDKGQVYLQIMSAGALLDRDGKLPVNVKFLIEGEEEVGGKHIEAYVASKPDLIQANAAIVCDTEMFAPGMPTLCVGLRGMVYGEIHVQGARQDLHSGMYGGAAPNPLMAIAEILTKLKDADGRILIPGFYDRVIPPSEKEVAAWNQLPFDEEEYREKEVGSVALVGEPGVPLFERTWARPTFEVHGIRGGFVGEGAKTVIPARAVVKISTRLVADQRPEEAAEQIRAAVAAACPKGVTAEFKLIHFAPASLVDTNNHFIQSAAEAMRQVFGRDTVYIRSGGSIPIVAAFASQLGMPSVLMGFGLPDDNIHSPNEKMDLGNFHLGIQAMARYLEILGN